MHSSTLTVYTPQSDLLRPRQLLRGMFRDLRNSRELAWRLAVRDLQAQYRQSYLGYFWAFITPLATTLAWIFLNASGVVKVADTSIPYPAYVFTGTMLWQVLVQALQAPMGAISSGKSMLVKLNFPREALILSALIKQLAAAGIKLAILLPAILLLGVVPDWHLALFPLALLALMLTGMAVGILLVPIGMLYNDIGRIVPLAAQFAMYITPVVFAMPTQGPLVHVFRFNPATPLVLTARAWLTAQETPMLGYFLGVSGAALLLLFFGWVILRITMPAIIERMS